MARLAAERAAAVLRRFAADHGSLAWEAKGRTDFVSAADRAAEDAVRETLARERPDAVILGEEGSPDAALGQAVAFVVDPLDGTTNFLHGYPWYGVSVGAVVGGEPAAGVVINVPTGELFAAALGAGAYRERADGARAAIAVSAQRDPSRALLGTGLPFKHAHHIEPYVRSLPRIMGAVAGVRRAGAAVLDLCDVACGRFDAFWELELAPWDMAAGMVIAREAGALVTDLRGAHARIATGPIVAGNPAMHAWLVEQLAETAAMLDG
ncbi:MAG: Inositol-1-monophosphatase [uncultured Gemmatimonadaceae bacterium]|uniref:Inositol-1-monophosphatase n=1 Tax=uncultured Gemmatimonadaceae bacterium TaxID=246130 RepID=A0A6J4L327_9BACT|nr:MAG: Inositol-1-monophosphatase [uncultured Gemmatimonadaceae bacterium]